MKTKLVIFGITGDLAGRKLLPVLGQIAADGYADLDIIGVSRRQVDVEALLTTVDVSRLIDRTTVFTMDLADADGYTRLKEYLNLKADEQALMYLSVPPGAAADIVDFLGEAGLNTPNVKILFEKPFGFDYTSAEEFIERTGKLFSEEQLYRIDHYMAKNIAANVLQFRADAQDERRWDNQSVASVEVIATEKIGIEGRAIFYEQTGALRDFVQGHLMQLLSLVLLDVSSFSMDILSERRLAALELLRPADPEKTVRAQYKGYDQEVENPGSRTETFVSVELESDDPRWIGVPLKLTTGKALDQKRSAIIITYLDGSTDVFEEGLEQVDEGRVTDAYERVLLEAVNGRRAIFTTSGEIRRSWQLLAPLQEAWAMEQVPLGIYTVGTAAEAVSAE